MAKYISGRVRRTDQDKLTDDRFKYLRLEDAEPNLGDSPDIAGTPSIPSGQQFQLFSVLNNPGERYWSPIQGGVIPGSISVFEEGSLVGTLSSITQLDFRGNGVTATVGFTSDVRSTITIKPQQWDLLMFPSILNHSVQPNQSTAKVRYSLAFNTFIRGTVGDSGSQLDIK